MGAKSESLASFISRHLSSMQFRLPGDLHPCPGPFSAHFFRTKPASPLPSQHHRVFANIPFKINASFAKEVAFAMSRRGGNASGDRQNLLGLLLNKAQFPPPTSYFRGIISPVPRGVLPRESGCPHDNRWI